MQQIQDLTRTQTPLASDYIARNQMDQDYGRKINYLKERKEKLKSSKAPFTRGKHDVNSSIFQILKYIDKEILNIKALINQTTMQFQLGQIITDQIINQQQLEQMCQKIHKLFSKPILRKMYFLNQMMCEEKNRKKLKQKKQYLIKNLWKFNP